MTYLQINQISASNKPYGVDMPLIKWTQLKRNFIRSRFINKVWWSPHSVMVNVFDCNIEVSLNFCRAIMFTFGLIPFCIAHPLCPHNLAPLDSWLFLKQEEGKVVFKKLVSLIMLDRVIDFNDVHTSLTMRGSLVSYPGHHCFVFLSGGS